MHSKWLILQPGRLFPLHIIAGPTVQRLWDILVCTMYVGMLGGSLWQYPAPWVRHHGVELRDAHQP